MEKRLTTDFDTYCKNMSLKSKIVKGLEKQRREKGYENKNCYFRTGCGLS